MATSNMNSTPGRTTQTGLSGADGSTSGRGADGSTHGSKRGADSRTPSGGESGNHSVRSGQSDGHNDSASVGHGRRAGKPMIPGRADGNPGLRAAALGLGLFSIGLGLAQLLAPRAVGRAVGMPDRTALLRAYGLREIASGVGLLASRDPRPWLWLRVAGDALDATALVTRATGSPAAAKRAKVALGLVAPVALLDMAYARMADSRARARVGAQYDYSDRVGFSGAAESMRGAASDFEVPADMRAPVAMRPYVAT